MAGVATTCMSWLGDGCIPLRLLCTYTTCARTAGDGDGDTHVRSTDKVVHRVVRSSRHACDVMCGIRYAGGSARGGGNREACVRACGGLAVSTSASVRRETYEGRLDWHAGREEPRRARVQAFALRCVWKRSNRNSSCSACGCGCRGSGAVKCHILGRKS